MKNTLKFERLNILAPDATSYKQYYCIPVTPQTKDVVDSLEFNNTYVPGVKRVVTSHAPERVVNSDEGPKTKPESYTTIVEFSDGSRTIVKCSDMDTPDTEMAIVNAIVKRAYGSLDPKGTTVADGCSLWLKKLVKNAWDQEKEESRIKTQKSAAKEAHIKRQQKEHAAATSRKSRKMAEQIASVLRALKDLGLDIGLDVQKVPSDATLLNEKTTCTDKCNCSKSTATKPSASNEYVRPAKKFSEFTQAEKREYWRNQKSKNK